MTVSADAAQLMRSNIKISTDRVTFLSLFLHAVSAHATCAGNSSMSRFYISCGLWTKHILDKFIPRGTEKSQNLGERSI